MELVALYDFVHGPEHDREIIHRGTRFTAKGTGVANAREHGQAYIKRGTACTPEDWPKLRDRTQAGWDWAQAEVARMNEGRTKRRN